MDVTESAREFLLSEGTDVRYGARPLKRAIKRLLLQPLSNLIASGQIECGDWITVTHSASSPVLTFLRDAEAFRSWGAHRAAA
jgi:ATP-dependent Clp protease ATP-binding subunit ClpA